jgi:hypothetical protein
VRRTISLLLAPALLAASTAHAEPSLSASPVYVYQKGHQWCALSDLKTFKRNAEAASANAFDVDEGRVWLSGGKVTAVEEYRSDADLEWSTRVKYQLDERGKVTSAEATFQNDEGTRKAAFKVADGSYRLAQGPREAAGFKFRRAAALSSFPFAGLAQAFPKRAAKETCG